MFETFKIKFNNRDSFNKAHHLIFSPNIRLGSVGDLDVGHADMIFSFSDKYHHAKAMETLRSHSITDWQNENS